MTYQATDPFYWENEAWVFLRAANIYSLFDPEAYGLHPTPPHTACWKGFVIQFRIVEQQLILDELRVYCEDGVYPPINGVEATSGQNSIMQTYQNINLPLPYSGTIVVGKGLKPKFCNREYTGPHSYETTFELTFQNGLLTRFKETSGTYFGI